VTGLLDPPRVPDDHVAGDPDAPLELVMYGDFECPYCAAAQSILARVRARLGDELVFVFRHMPDEEAHPHARHAAEAAEAAAAQGAFWPMHDALYAGRGHLADRDLVAHARGVGLDGDRIAAELRDGVHAARVQRDLETGLRSGVTGTPGFFVNGRLHEGAYDAGSLVEALRGGRG
jgi:protein-disulfide isomerase